MVRSESEVVKTLILEGRHIGKELRRNVLKLRRFDNVRPEAKVVVVERLLEECRLERSRRTPISS